MITTEWKTGYCEYAIQSQPNVKVTTLHWQCIARDDDTTQTATNIGTVDAGEQNRVYTLQALQNVPESVMTGWVQQALGAEEVAQIEQNVTEQLDAILNPTTGGLVPEQEDEPA